MVDRLIAAARKWVPAVDTLTRQQQLILVGDSLALAYSLPLLALALAWLVNRSSLALVGGEWPLFATALALIVLYDRLTFFINFEMRPGQFAFFESSFEGMATFATYLLFGPVAFWVPFLLEFLPLVRDWRQGPSRLRRVGVLRVFALNNAGGLLSLLAANWLYTTLGGSLPLPGLRSEHFLPALAAIAIGFGVILLVYSLYTFYMVWVQIQQGALGGALQIVVFLFRGFGLRYLAFLFGILAAGIYTQNQQIASFLFFHAGMLMVAVVARRLSYLAESSRQQTRQLQKLEALGRSIIAGPPDASALPQILSEHLPGMFTYRKVVIYLQDRGFLVAQPEETWPQHQSVWAYLAKAPKIQAWVAGQPLPWQDRSRFAVVLAPIYEWNPGANNAGGQAANVGYIYLELQAMVHPWSVTGLTALFPGIQSLAAQVASTLYQARVYLESLDLQRSSAELRLAGEIQSSFFPDEIPQLDGWQLAVTILPARETSGDFFDFIPLEDGRLGILIADVTDKGMGPALYMALSRTLIRTYAVEYEAEPDVVFFATNERILSDARASLYVTAFYGVLDPVKNELVYCNAGHNPPYLVRKNGSVEALTLTGMPIGMDGDVVWQTASIHFEPGDQLLMYTDGIPDSINLSGEFFEEDRLIETALQNQDGSALEIQAAIIEAVQAFSAGAPQVDDITLIVLLREEEMQPPQPIFQGGGATEED